PAEARRVLSGLNATVSTVPTCPRKVSTRWAVWVSQSSTSPSVLPAASRVPSGLKTRQVLMPVEPDDQIARRWRVLTSHTLMPASPHTANRLPLGSNAAAAAIALLSAYLHAKASRPVTASQTFTPSNQQQRAR